MLKPAPPTTAAVPSRIPKDIALEIVELYPYVEYMKYLLPGSIALAMFVSVMIGGGMLYIDDKARGVHEGFLVTPITRLELVLGLNTAGSIKAVLSGVVITTIGSLLAGVSTIFDPGASCNCWSSSSATSIAFNAMMFLMMVRVEDPLVPRAMFGILNTLLFFPERQHLPDQCISRMASGDCASRSVHLRRPWTQRGAAERVRIRGDFSRRAFPDGIRPVVSVGRHGTIQADAVGNKLACRMGR